jgi:hypothetical protein
MTMVIAARRFPRFGVGLGGRFTPEEYPRSGIERSLILGDDEAFDCALVFQFVPAFVDGNADAASAAARAVSF